MSKSKTRGSQVEMDDCAKRLKALAEPMRLRILQTLRMGELTVSDIALFLESDLVKVSHHLRVLYRAEVVKAKRVGKFTYYSLNSSLYKSSSSKDEFDFGCCQIAFRG